MLPFSWLYFCSQELPAVPTPAAPRSRRRPRSPSARRSPRFFRASSFVVLLVGTLCLTGGCSITEMAKQAASAAAERAATRAISEGKTALRGLGRDLFEATKAELQTTGNLQAMRAGEIMRDAAEKNLSAPVVNVAKRAARSYVGNKPEEEWTLLQQLLAGFGGTAATAMTAAGASQVSKNSNDRKIQQKKYEAELLAKVPIPNGAS